MTWRIARKVMRMNLRNRKFDQLHRGTTLGKAFAKWLRREARYGQEFRP